MASPLMTTVAYHSKRECVSSWGAECVVKALKNACPIAYLLATVREQLGFA